MNTEAEQCMSKPDPFDDGVENDGIENDGIEQEAPKSWIRSLFNLTSFVDNPKFKLTVLRKMEYKDSYIYVFQYKNMFQYLFSIKNEIYEGHIFLKPRLRRWILSFFGKSLYSNEEMDYGEQVVMSGAISSFDQVLINSDEEPTPVPENS